MGFADLEKIVERDEVWIAAVFYRQASASQEEATKILEALELPNSLMFELMDFPNKGLDSVVPTDPLL